MDDTQSVVQKLQRLSKREREVFGERCQGKSIADIADSLVIVESTVKHHLGNIYAKLELDHLPQAARNFEIPKFCEALPLVPAEELGPESAFDPPQPMSLVPVLEDELALVQQEQGIIQLWSPGMSPPNSNRPFTQHRQRSVRNLMILIVSTAVISGLAGAGIMALIFTLATPVVSPQQAQPTTLAISPQAPPTLAPTMPPPSPPLSIPINDNFADALVIDRFPYTNSLNLTLATSEVNEPLDCSEGACVNYTTWYQFAPTTTTGLIFEGRSDFQILVMSYKGSNLDSLIQVGSIKGGGQWNRTAIPTTFLDDTTYYLQISGILGGNVDIKFERYLPSEIPTLMPSSRLINDNFADALVIKTLPFTSSLNLKLATTEVGEPLLCTFDEGGDQYTDHTVWYRFTPATTVGLIGNKRSELDTSIIVYSGSSLASLRQLGCVTSGGDWSRGPIPTPFIGGTTYYLQIGSVLGSTVDFKFELYEP